MCVRIILLQILQKYPLKKLFIGLNIYHYCIHSFLKLGTSNNESIGSKRIVQSTAKELCQGKETCGKRATFDVQRSVYHCSRRLAQSQRLIERMDKAVVRIETWTSFDLQNSKNKSKFIEYLIIIDFAKILLLIYKNR